MSNTFAFDFEGLIVSHLAVDTADVNIFVKSETRHPEQKTARTNLTLKVAPAGVKLLAFVKGVDPKVNSKGYCAVQITMQHG